MRRLLRLVVPIGEDIEASRNAIQERFTLRDGNGKPVMAGPNEVAFSDPFGLDMELREFLKVMEEHDVEPLTPEELKREGIILTGDQAYRLGPLLAEPAVSEHGVKEVALVEPPPP
jgi:hypothetical protein